MYLHENLGFHLKRMALMGKELTPGVNGSDTRRETRTQPSLCSLSHDFKANFMVFCHLPDNFGILGVGMQGVPVE